MELLQSALRVRRLSVELLLSQVSQRRGALGVEVEDLGKRNLLLRSQIFDVKVCSRGRALAIEQTNLVQRVNMLSVQTVDVHAGPRHRTLQIQRSQLRDCKLIRC